MPNFGKPKPKPVAKPVEKPAPPSHVIHTDGTYSNAPVKISKRGLVDRYKTLILEYEGETRHEKVRDFDKTGVWTKPASMKRNPSLHECNFWKWNEIDACLMDVV